MGRADMHSARLPHLNKKQTGYAFPKKQRKVIMPRWQSVEGKWYPVKEYHVNAKAKPGENPVYEGPDRASQEILDQQGVKFIGNDFRLDVDIKRQTREHGFTTPDEYIENMFGVDVKANKKKSEEALENILHTDEQEVITKPPTRQPSGGDDTSGQGNSRSGGFGEPGDMPSNVKMKTSEVSGRPSGRVKAKK